MAHRIAVITNARDHGQHSMLGYGQLVLEAARGFAESAVEVATVSPLSRAASAYPKSTRLGKLARNIDRMCVTPLFLAGRSADIVHIVDPGNVIYLDLIGHRASVVTVHDMIPYLCMAGRLGGFRPTTAGRWLMQRILSRLRRVDRIVCVSEATRRDLIDIAVVDPERIVSIPNAVFQPMVPAEPQVCREFRREFGLPLDAPLVLHVGHNFYKNRRTVLDVFARVLDKHTGAHLFLVGALTPELAAAVRELRLEANVHTTPYIAPERMAALYTTASLLLFPSLYEGFGYPVLEAQLCGTPVVCSNGGSLAEVAGDGARVFSPLDVESMAAAAVELLASRRAAADLAERGRRNAARFTRERWFAAHAALYEDLAAQLTALGKAA